MEDEVIEVGFANTVRAAGIEVGEIAARDLVPHLSEPVELVLQPRWPSGV
jgi:hypothetical protein